MNNIILIGMPGCGKSTLGVLLAKNLAYHFLDSDLLIQQKAGKKLQDILDQDGNEAFGKLENEVNLSLDIQNTVLATGGSAVYWEESMLHLKSIGLVVYLQVPYEELKSRITNMDSRGIVIPEGKTFRDIYEERNILYLKYADLVISEKNDQDLWTNCCRVADAIHKFEEGI
jgi:shikimate kinase